MACRQDFSQGVSALQACIPQGLDDLNTSLAKSLAKFGEAGPCGHHVDICCFQIMSFGIDGRWMHSSESGIPGEISNLLAARGQVGATAIPVTSRNPRGGLANGLAKADSGHSCLQTCGIHSNPRYMMRRCCVTRSQRLSSKYKVLMQSTHIRLCHGRRR